MQYFKINFSGILLSNRALEILDFPKSRSSYFQIFVFWNYQRIFYWYLLPI